MPGRHAPLIAREGIPFILTAVAATIAGWHFFGWAGICAGAALLLFLILIFRDPYRDVPSVALGVVSPVDGRVAGIEKVAQGVLEREALRITIIINNFGAYTVRSPVEGKVLSLQENEAVRARLGNTSGLWVQTDENDDVVLLFRGPPFIGRPAGFVRYGERIGQGQRCAFVRLARHADLYLPATSRVEVAAGDMVKSGSSLLATLIHK
ncbi:MAG: phosphatidylserine decarboxylase [Gammaproteobacteria bacterium]